MLYRSDPVLLTMFLCEERHDEALVIKWKNNLTWLFAANEIAVALTLANAAFTVLFEPSRAPRRVPGVPVQTLQADATTSFNFVLEIRGPLRWCRA